MYVVCSKTWSLSVESCLLQSPVIPVCLPGQYLTDQVNQSWQRCHLKRNFQTVQNYWQQNYHERINCDRWEKKKDQIRFAHVCFSLNNMQWHELQECQACASPLRRHYYPTVENLKSNKIMPDIVCLHKYNCALFLCLSFYALCRLNVLWLISLSVMFIYSLWRKAQMCSGQMVRNSGEQCPLSHMLAATQTQTRML